MISKDQRRPETEPKQNQKQEQDNKRPAEKKERN